MDNQLDISARIEALLFFKGEPVSVHSLAGMLKVSDEEAQAGVDALDMALKNARRGIVVMRDGDEVMLGTEPTMGVVIEKVEGSTTRSTTYLPTFEHLSYMGVSRVEDLPEYEGVGSAVEEFKNTNKEESNEYEEEHDGALSEEA